MKNQEGRNKVQRSPKTDKVKKRESWLRRFFLGVDKKVSCVMGRAIRYTDHWLVGSHTEHTVVC